MKTVYIQSKSKAAANRELKEGKTLLAYEFNFLTGDNQIPINKDGGLENGTVIKIFEKYAQGNPYAKSYGTWKDGKIA